MKFEELLSKYEAAVEIKASQIAEIDDRISELEIAIDVRKEKLSNPLALTVKEHLEAEHEIELFSHDLRFFVEQKTLLQKIPAMSREDFTAFYREITEAIRAEKEESDKRLLAVASELLEPAAKYTTEINKLYSLCYAVAHSIGRNYGVYPNGRNDALISPMLSYTNQLIKNGINPLSDRFAVGYDADELEAARIRIREAEAKISDRVLPDLHLT